MSRKGRQQKILEKERVRERVRASEIKREREKKRKKGNDVVTQSSIVSFLFYTATARAHIF
jgi:hypothetical protein